MIVILNAILGALWRRWLGLGGSGPRWLKMVLGALLTWPLWLALPWWQAAIGTAFCLVYFADGHKVDHWTVWLRYGPFAIGYVLARKYWPDRWTYGRWFDGWMAVGEYVLGGLFWGFVASLTLFLAAAPATVKG